MPDDRNFFASLVDFSFQQQLLRRIVKVLYILGIVGGAIYVVYFIVVGFQQSPADGLINFGIGIVSLFLGILIWRTLLELALVVLRISESIDRATHSGN